MRRRKHLSKLAKILRVTVIVREKAKSRSGLDPDFFDIRKSWTANDGKLSTKSTTMQPSVANGLRLPGRDRKGSPGAST